MSVCSLNSSDDNWAINHLLCAPNTVLSLPKHQPSEEAPRSPQHMSTHQPLLSGCPVRACWARLLNPDSVPQWLFQVRIGLTLESEWP